MTKCVDLVVYVAVAASCASVGGKAALLAGGCGYDCLVAVSECLDCLGVGITAGLAGVCLDTALGASGLGGHFALIVGVTQCIGFICHVAVAASCASIGSKSALLASRCSYDCFVAVSDCLNFLGVSLTASLAGIGLNTALGASGFGRHFAIVVGVTQCIGLICHVAVTASCASVGGKSALLAGGCGHN